MAKETRKILIFTGLILTAATLVILNTSCGKRKNSATPKIDTISWLRYDDGLKQAAQDGRHILVYFWRPGCTWCEKMENTTFADTLISNLIKAQFIPVKINGWSDDKFQTAEGELSGKQLADKYRLTGYPAMWFLESDGTPINFFPGYAQPQDFEVVIKYVGSGEYKRQSLKDFAHSMGRVF
jgi:protein disulfide-isomerase